MLRTAYEGLTCESPTLVIQPIETNCCLDLIMSNSVFNSVIEHQPM